MALNSSSHVIACCGVLLALGASPAQAQQAAPGGEGATASQGEVPAVTPGPLRPNPPGLGVPDVEARAGGDRPTIQQRFAPKAKLLYSQGTFTTHVRDDFYDSLGGGLQLGFFPTERWGIEARAIFLRTRLDNAAIDLKERIGLVPDARPQDLWLMLGTRYSPGYGKLLMWRRFVVHFDPQLVLHAGVARAESRLIPTLDLAFGLMTHWRWGIKATLDLGMSLQTERRERGWVFTTGFAPVLGVGWGKNF